MFDLNRHYDRPENRQLIQIKHVHCMSHTNRQPIKNTIGVVMNHLVGIALYAGSIMFCFFIVASLFTISVSELLIMLFNQLAN